MIRDLLQFHRFVRKHPLASRDMAGTWKRWLRWQIGSRILKTPVVFPWLEGASLVIEQGMTGATGNIYCGLHEFADMALVLHYFGGGNGVFLDVGANIGSYSVLAAKVREAQVIAIEPAPETFAKLMRNVRVNDICTRVEAHQAAAGAQADQLRFTADCDTTNRVAGIDYSGATVVVPVRTLDSILNDRTAHFWKIDVEGYEMEVLKGAANALADIAVDVVLLEAGGPEIAEVMREHGFAECAYDPWQRRISCGAAAKPGENHVWMRRPEIVESRCRSASPISVFGWQV